MSFFIYKTERIEIKTSIFY